MHTMSLTDLVPGQLYQLQDKYTIMTEMLECPQPSMWTFVLSEDGAVFLRSEWAGDMLEMILLKTDIEYPEGQPVFQSAPPVDRVDPL